MSDDEYECTLDEAAIKVAKDELYEDPKDRLSSVQTFREWILKQKHITCRTDTAYLLRYLRGAKFSQLRTRELLQNTMQAMTKLPKWFQSIDTQELGVQEYFKLGVAFPLPKRDHLNRRILLIRPGVICVKNKYYSLDNEMRSAFCVSNLICKDELTQVYGFVLLFDFTGFTMKHVKASWSSENSRNTAKVWQDCTPGRVKAFHFYNAGIFFEAMMTFSRPFLKKKTQQRMHIHDTLESLYKYIPAEYLPQEYVPDDFPNHAGTTSSILKDVQRVLLSDEYRQEILNSTKPDYGFNKSLKPTDDPAESFRKLTVD